VAGDRDAEFNITARYPSGGTVKKAADDFDDLGDAAAKAQRKIDDVGDELGHVSRRLAEARVAAAGFAKEFDRSGDERVLRTFAKANAEAAKFGRVLKTLKIEPKFEEPRGYLGDFVRFAKGAGLIGGEAMVSSFGDAIVALPAEVKGPALLAGLVIVGALQGAITAGVAAGGIAAGLALGAQDDRVKAAYAALGATVFSSLKADASGFTFELLDLAPKLQKAFDKESPRFKRIFDDLANDVDPILDNVVASFDRLAPSLERAAAAGGRVLVSTSGSLDALASSVGFLMDTLSDSSTGAAASLNILIYTVSGMVIAFTSMQAVIGPVWQGLGKIAELTGITGEHVKHLDTIQRDAAVGAGLTAEQYAMLSYDLGSTAGQARALGEAFDRLFNTQMGVDQANLAVNAGMLNLTQTIKDNKKTLNQSTESGVQNTQVILQQIQALDAKRQADIAAGNGTVEATAKANAAYAGNVAALRQVLINMGLAASEVDALIAAYARIPANISTTITTVYRQVGNKSGISDEATGHSRTGTQDYSGLSSWAPGRHVAAARAAAFTAPSGMVPTDGGADRHQPPVQVHAENTFTVLLDGQPFRAVAVRTVAASEKRQAWRAKVGAR
jgi:hypothetical protein